MFVAAGGVQSRRYSILTNLGIFSWVSFFLVLVLTHPMIDENIFIRV